MEELLDKGDVTAEHGGLTGTIYSDGDDSSIDTIFKDGIGTYVGQRNEKGERHGKGISFYPNGDSYAGEFKNMKRHGKGVYIFQNKVRFTGDYKNGLRHGFGLIQYEDSSIYTGIWKNNLKNGVGTYIYKNGDQYTGSWLKNQRHGLGTYTFKESNIEFYGIWENDKRVGTCRLKFLTYTYDGTWNKTQPIGPGRYSFSELFSNNGYYINYKENPKWICTDYSIYKRINGPELLEESSQFDSEVPTTPSSRRNIEEAYDEEYNSDDGNAYKNFEQSPSPEETNNEI